MTDALTPDLLAAADDMAEWAVQHASEAGLHPSLPTVAEDAEARMKDRWARESVAAIRNRMAADRQQQLSAALESLRAPKGS